MGGGPVRLRPGRPTVALVVLATLVVLVAVAGGLSAASGRSANGDGVRTTPVRPGSLPVAPTRPPTLAASDWTTYDQNGERTGVDPSGASFSPATPAWTSPTLDGRLYGQPLVYAGRVFVATEDDTVYALAARTGAVLWATQVGDPFHPGSVRGLCGNIGPTVGITSTPVIDPARDELFVVAAEQVPGNASHHLVGLDLASGAVLLDEVVDPPGTDPAYQLQRASLALADGRVIVGFGGNAGDCGPCHGLVVSAPEDGAPPSTFVVADRPGDRQGAVWMGGGAPVVDASGDLWVSTGNSAFTTPGKPYDQSDGVLELSPTLKLLQEFAPSDWYADNRSDLDLSTPPVLLADGLVFALGKSSTAYVLDRASLGGVGGELLARPACFGHGAAAHVGDTVYTGCGDGVSAYRVTGDPPALTALWSTSTGGGGTPIVAGGGVWSIGGGSLNEVDPATGATEQRFPLGSSPSSFPSPSAGDGLVLAPTTDSVKAFEGPAGLPPAPGPLPPVGP